MTSVGKAKPRITVLAAVPEAIGWEPINDLIHLIGRTFEAEVCRAQGGKDLRWGKALRLSGISSLRDRRSSDILLAIVSTPTRLIRVVRSPEFDRPAALRIGWIVDSFWTDQVDPGAAREFDLLIHMQKEDAGFYNGVLKRDALYLGWGADLLRAEPRLGPRDIDVLRVGRQPAAWEDDARTAAAATTAGLTFHGRPSSDLTYRELQDYYARAKYVLAFSNLLAPAPYTHPSKSYFTARWMDAIGNGAAVAGISPKEDRGIYDSLWDEALYELSGLDLDEGMKALRAAVDEWTPQKARLNSRRALEALDWRLRLQTLSGVLGLTFPRLEEEIAMLGAKAQALR